MDREQIKTTPEMTINVKQMLKMSDDPTNQYAAQLIEELEAQVKEMEVLRIPVKDKGGYYIPASYADAIEYYISQVKAKDEEIKRLKEALVDIEKRCDWIDRDRSESDKVMCNTQSIRCEIAKAYPKCDRGGESPCTDAQD